MDGLVPFRQVLNASTDVGESGLGSLHAEQPGGALEAIEELAEHLIAENDQQTQHKLRKRN